MENGAQMISDYYCQICQDLWVEPVTLPCHHVMCKDCYFRNEAANPLQCPFCKKSVRSWTRKAKKNGSYVDAELWEKTRSLFPAEVTRRLQGESVEIPDKEIDFSYLQTRRHYDDGELRKEYEKEKAEREAELEHRRQSEENASEELLRTLGREEELLRRIEEEKKRQEDEDAKFAAKLAEQKSPSKFPQPKITRNRAKGVAPPKDQPTLETILTTPKRKLSRRDSSPSTPSTPSESQRSLQRAVEVARDRIQRRSLSPESPELEFDFSHRVRRRRPRVDVFADTDEEDEVEKVEAKSDSPPPKRHSIQIPVDDAEGDGENSGNSDEGKNRPTRGIDDKEKDSSATRASVGGDDNSSFPIADTSTENQQASFVDKSFKSLRNSISLSDKPLRESLVPEDLDSVNVSFAANSSATLLADESDFSLSNESAQSFLDDSSLTVEASTSLADRSSTFLSDLSSPSVPALVSEEIQRLKSQEEEDLKLARKLHRQFENERRAEMTKRPDGYGTRSRSPTLKKSIGSQDSLSPDFPSTATARKQRRAATESSPASKRVSRSQSLGSKPTRKPSSTSSDRENAVPADCPHRDAGAGKSCSFCLLTSPNHVERSVGDRGGAAKGKGAGKGLKRKTSNLMTPRKKRIKN